jgi:hypothetical protein
MKAKKNRYLFRVTVNRRGLTHIQYAVSARDDIEARETAIKLDCELYAECSIEPRPVSFCEIEMIYRIDA